MAQLICAFFMTHKPTFKEFKAKAAKGNFIPVYREIFADLDTPVSAYLKIRGKAHSFLLESDKGKGTWDRYSFFGCGPFKIVSSKGDKVTVLENGKETVTTNSKKPLDTLKEILAQYKPVQDDNLPFFTGGAVGFIGYDMARFFEELDDKNKDDLHIPDSLFVIADTLMIFDNMSQTIKIVSNAFTKGGNLREVYDAAKKKIDGLVKKLRQNTSKFYGAGDKIKKYKETSYTSNFEKKKFKAAVINIKKRIKRGDAIQVVLSQRLEIKYSKDAFTIYRALRTVNPSPYMYYLEFGNIRIVGSSPETLVRLEGKNMEVRPIAGTKKRGKTVFEDIKLEKELLADPKERAEHVMLVDLGRNDLGRFARPKSVVVNESFKVERYSHVMHIVSNVQAKLRKESDCFDLLRATFPAGTLSGAPKVQAMKIIEELESTRRGLYGGAVGYISFNGNMDMAIAIRTLLVKDKVAYLGVGAGIVADSKPENEFKETMHKGKALLEAIAIAEQGLPL